MQFLTEGKQINFASRIARHLKLSANFMKFCILPPLSARTFADIGRRNKKLIKGIDNHSRKGTFRDTHAYFRQIFGIAVTVGSYYLQSLSGVSLFKEYR